MLSHWTDQCQKFVSLSLENRIKAVKENYACFSCLKRAGETTGPITVLEDASVLKEAMEASARIIIILSYTEQFSRLLQLLRW